MFGHAADLVRAINRLIIAAVLIIIYVPVMGLARILSALAPAKKGWQSPEASHDASSPY